MKRGIDLSSAPSAARATVLANAAGRIGPRAMRDVAPLACKMLPAAALAMLVAAGCSNDDAPTGAAGKPVTPVATPGPPGKAKGPTAVNEAELPKIPIIPGYKYYIGGPFLAPDKWGKQRIMRFEGEVAQPPSRGMVFGVKQEGDNVEYKVWGNGRILGFHRGKMREGRYWDDYLEGYKNGKVVARETLTHDDAAQQTKVVTEELDLETGEPIRTKELILSYTPPEDPEGEESEGAGTASGDSAPAAPKDAAAPNNAAAPPDGAAPKDAPSPKDPAAAPPGGGAH
jgi:hypothetical protein